MSYPAIRSIQVVVSRNHVHVRSHRPHGSLRVVNGQSVAENQGLRISSAQAVMHDLVILLRSKKRKVVDQLNPASSRAELERGAGIAKRFKSVNASGCHPVPQQLPPFSLVAVVKKLPKQSLGMILPIFREIPFEQRCIPPSYFVVRKIADTQSELAMRRSEAVRAFAHPSR